MRNLVLLFTALILGTTSTMATVTAEDKVAERNAYRYNDSFIFVEEGITFSVYPDGEFDFYIDNRVGRRNRKNVTFNSGFDYSPYAQYDDYGAVVQVENIPIYYDYNGRVSQIGDVNINYRNGRVRTVGNMYVYYNNRGFYDYHTGYINRFNRFYTWSPFHAFFARPAIGFCLVNVNPYRRWYNPIRYTYYNPYRYNQRWSYAKIGREHRYNKTRSERASVYRNDKRVAVRENRSVRSNRTVSKGRGNNSARTNRVAKNRDNRTVRNSKTIRRNGDLRSNRSGKVAGRTSADRTKRIETRTVKRSDRGNRTVTKRSSTVRSPRQEGTVTKRSTTRAPQRKTVSRNTTVKRPQNRTSRALSKAPVRVRSSASKGTSSQRRAVSKTPTRRNNTYSRSSSSRSRVSKAPSRSRSTAATRSSSRSRASKAPARSNSRSSTTRSRSGRRQ